MNEQPKQTDVKKQLLLLKAIKHRLIWTNFKWRFVAFFSNIYLKIKLFFLFLIVKLKNVYFCIVKMLTNGTDKNKHRRHGRTSKSED